MAAPTMYSDEELYQQTGSWEAAAALRDEQNNALNQYNWSQQAATTPVSLPNYENAYDAFGGKEATDSLLAQLRALGLSEDTINSALTPYFKTAAVTSPAITSSAATPPSNIPTFSEQITAGPGTTQNEFMSLVSEPASTVVGGTGNDTVTGAKGNDTVVAASADTSNAGNVLSGNILAGASWNSTNKTLADQLTAATGQQTFNTAVGGATTADTLNQLNTFLDSGGSFAPGSTVFLQTGGVDMLQGVDQGTITNNINQIVSTLGQYGVKVVLTGSPEVDSMEDVTSGSFDTGLASFYNDIAANNSNVSLVDSMGRIFQDPTLLSDALHTNAAGEQVYNQSVIDAYNRLVNSGVDTNTAATIAVQQANTGAESNDTVVGGTGNDTVVGAAADNITRSGLTGQAGQMVVEGDDIETQIAQLPTEYAHWSRSADQRTMELIRKSDGAVLDRRTVGDYSDVDLAKIGLSFIPGAGQILAGLNVADAVRRGDLLQAAIGVTGLMPGAQNVNTALRVGQAVDSGNTFGALTALAGNTDLQNLTGLNTANVGGFTAKDVMAAGSLTQAALAGNTAGVLTSLGTLAGSSDTVLAGRALGLITRIQNGDTRALGEAISLSNSVAGGGSTTGSTGSTGSTAAAITTLSEEDLAELKPGELNAYQTGGVQGLADFRRDMKLLTGLTTSGRTGDDTGGDTTTTSTVVGGTGNDVTLPTGVQLASTGDGVFRTDVGGTPIFAESKNAGTVTPPFGYTLLSSTEADNKPDGAYYDITANAWFKPSTDLTDLTGGTTLKADTDLFNSSLGDLDGLDNTNRTTDDFADFLKTIGITNVSQLTDSGLSNQDILDMINALDDTVSVTGAKGNDSITGVTGLDSIKGGTGNDNIETVSITGAKGNDTVTGIDTIKGGNGNDLVVDDKGTVTIVDKKESCPIGSVLNPQTGECEIVDDKGTVTIVDKKESCPIGTVLNPETGECEAIPETLTCPPGKVLNEAGTACIDEVIIKDKKESCPIGTVLNPETGECEAVTEQPITCPAGYELNDAGTECIPVVTITDKKCDTGFVYDEDLKMCVPITVDETCPTGFHKDESGKCVPDTKEDLKCPEGYEPNEAGTECIPVVTIVDKKCPPGQVYDEDLKMCVPVKPEECPEGYHRDPVTGACVPDEEKCKPGFHKDETGACVPDEVKCEKGYHLEDGVCVKDKLECPKGYELNDAGTECIPIIEIVDKKCPTGFVYDEDLKQCVPIKEEDKCPTGYHRDESGACVKDAITCPTGYELNDAGTECIPIIEIVDKKCPVGQVYDEELKKCVPIKEDKCPEGFERDELTGKCIPVVVITDKKCQTGFVYDEELKKCVPIKEEECPAGYHRDESGVCVKDAITCPKGYELNDAGTECIPVVEIVDKKCAAGFVYDEELKKCVPIEEDKCPTGYHRDASGTCVQDECPEGYVRNLVTGVCEKPLVCEEGFELNDEGTECIPVIKVTACPIGQHRDETGKCVPDTEECAEGFHLEDGICVPDDDEKCQDGYEKVNGACVPVCQEGYIRNLETGTCEKPEDKSCPIGQVRNAEGKCVPVTSSCPAGQVKDATGKCVPITIQCPTGFKLVNGACVPITTTTPTYTTGASGAQGEKIDPIYAGGMDDFNLLATLEELLSNEAPKKDTKKSKDKTKMATGGHLDDLLAEQMTVDDLLKLLR